MSTRDRPNDLLAPSQRENRAHRGVTVTQSHMCVHCARNRLLNCYEQGFLNLQRGVFDLDDYEAGYDAQYCLSAEDDGERATTYEQVLRREYKKDWMRAMKSEIKSLAQHNTCTFVYIPSDRGRSGASGFFEYSEINPGDCKVQGTARGKGIHTASRRGLFR
uniref:Uncharacterized protein n=1 Tax=Peronospora matthiolae TaxID=2874970 RepID=A0AAV1UQL1_9STRA